MRFLITFVGEQDPISEKTNEEGSIVTLCRREQPDLVLLLPSAAAPGNRSNTEDNARLTVDWLISEAGYKQEQFFIRSLDLPDPRNFTQILESGKRVIIDFFQHLPIDDDTEIILNTSSGTPQMKTCIFLWSSEGLFSPAKARLFQVANPKYLAEEDKRVEEIGYEFLAETNTLERIRKYIERYLFLPAATEAETLARISSYSQRRDKAKTLNRVLLAYHKWDLLDFAEADRLLLSVKSNYENTKDLGGLTEILRSQLEVLDRLKGLDEENLYNLVDIFYNAKRRLGANAYADALARVWRVIEGCIYYRLREHGIEPTNLVQSKEKKNLQLVEVHFPPKRSLTLLESQKALSVLGDNAYLQFAREINDFSWGEGFRRIKNEEALGKSRELRNNSVVAHGMKPVDYNMARLSIEVAENLLRFIFKDNKLIDDYPFCPKNFRLVYDCLLK